jgi:antitoxin (DNA-binding transcriptional repressor) of toxin-antitoxin stability system
LKERTSDILRRMRDEGEAFEVTYRGRVIGRLVPMTTPATQQKSLEEFWKDWDQLAEEITAHWPEGVSAVDAIREVRRDL